MSFNLQSAICGLCRQSAVCGRQSAVCILQSAVCGLQSAVCSLRSAACKCRTPGLLYLGGINVPSFHNSEINE